MKKRITDYLNHIDSILAANEIKDFDELAKNHLIQISFFQHERLIHLIVTIIFALLEMMGLLHTIVYFSMPVFFMTILFLVLLIPYIRHYYLLENGVQKMYQQYDIMLSKITTIY